MIVLPVRNSRNVLMHCTTHCTNKNNLEYVESLAVSGISGGQSFEGSELFWLFLKYICSNLYGAPVWNLIQKINLFCIFYNKPLLKVYQILLIFILQKQT